MLEGIWTIENKNPPKPITWGVPENKQRNKPRRKMVRQREVILGKLRNRLELEKMGKKETRRKNHKTYMEQLPRPDQLPPGTLLEDMEVWPMWLMRRNIR